MAGEPRYTGDSEAPETVDSLVRAVARASYVEPGPVEGDTIGGSFRIERKLGAGGMGVVYLARDLRLQRSVALKLHSGGDGALRTEREARVLARLVHPNVVTIYDVGTWRGRTYIAMEYLDGGTLREWLASGPRGWREILSIFVQAARGLEAAHQAGLVHRDFKPDNVLLGSDGRVRVADFGLARSVRVRAGDPAADEVSDRTAPRPASAAAAIDAPLTATGACIGTPGYMAPEAERGDEVDARADQYSFCVALSAALEGRRPPRWIAPIVERGRDADPARRHASLGALLDPLERRLERRLQRRWWIAPAAIAAVVAVAVPVWSGGRDGQAILAAATVCPAPALPALHVDGAAAPGGNGSAVCPFRTVTQALAVSAPSRVIHVAAGRYDAEHGEQLPLTVRGATEIRGAGAEVTVIAGVGYFDPHPDGVAATEFPLRATIVVGDDRAAIALSGISVESGQREIADGSVGILCGRGNLHAFEGAMPAPNTRLDQIVVGPGYETGLVVTGGSSPGLSGCNLSVDGGLFHDSNAGIWQVGCGKPHAVAPTALQVDRSSFRALRGKPRPTIDAGQGAGIVVWDCARDFRVSDSLFADSDYGVILARHTELQPGAVHDADEPLARIERNQLGALGTAGVFLDRAVRVELLANQFWQTPAAIAIHAAPIEPPYVRARDNRIGNNAIAVELRGRGAIPAGTVIDFGRPDQPGHNWFHCNGTQGALRATVAVHERLAPGAALQFFGDAWDHAPARVRRGKSARDRAEVAIAAGGAAVDVGGGEPTGEVCATP